MVDVALADLVRQFVVRGENLGTMHPALAALRITSYETATDAAATVVRGRCEFNGYLRIDTNDGLKVAGGVDEAASTFDPLAQSPVFDIRQTAVEFELTTQRAGSPVIASGVAALGSPTGFANTKAVLDALANPAPGATPSDYPATDFTLELMLDAPRLRPPFLHPAKLNDLGTLSPDDTKTEVALTLPRLRFRVSQSAAGLRVEFTSAGAESLDDPGDIGVAELISMDPPYAFVGGDDDRAVGIGLRSATLDLSGGSTPPALKDKAGVGDDWTGIYLPDARIFVAPTADRGLAFDVGAKELLIGLGKTAGLWGDFEAVLVNQGSTDFTISARFADEGGKLYAITGDGVHATAMLPQKTQMVVDVAGGARAPQTISAKIGSAASSDGKVFQVDFGDSAELTIVITVVAPGANGAVTKTLTITATVLSSKVQLAVPGPQKAATDITVGDPTGALQIVVVDKRADEVVLGTHPRDATVEWAIDGVSAGPAAATVTVPVATGQNRTITAHKPASVVPAAKPFYLTYDQPKQRTSTPDVSTAMAADDSVPVKRLPGGQDSMTANKDVFAALPDGANITITGQASKEANSLDYNYQLAIRRAQSVRDAIDKAYSAKHFVFTLIPPSSPGDTAANWDAATGWSTHTVDRNQWWRADVAFPTPAAPAAKDGSIPVSRPPVAPPDVPKKVPDTPPEAPDTPAWFRSAALKVRVVATEIIAVEADLEVDFQTFSEEQLRKSGQLPAGSQAPDGKALKNGSAVGPENPADGITKFRLLVQSDPATGKIETLFVVGADPTDKNGLYLFGWMPGDTDAPTKDDPDSPKDFARTLLGSYLTFWPLLATFPPVEAAQGLADGEVTPGDVVDAALAGAALVTPGIVAALPWFQVERVIVFGGEFDGSWRKVNGKVGFDGRLLFDIEVDWSANFLGLVEISPLAPLKVRYKAIGLRFGNTEDDGSTGFMLRPVFDSGRGYTIDLASGGGIKLIDPLGQILKILGARVSKQNPMTFEIEIGLGVDLGVVRVDKAGLRVFLDEARPPELTALAATVDIPGALIGSGYVKIGKSQDSQGHDISVIAGQLDLTLRTISLRVCAAVAIATIPADAGGPATGVYVGLDVILPVGIPLGSTGLGIFGFRGIFGMHYQRNPTIGQGTNIPSLAWLQAADGRPNLLANNGQDLWVPEIDHWAFGIGILIGTMEGGYIINLDGTFLLELPGPRVIIMLNARIVSPPPTMDKVGMSGGILAVIEISPEHFLIGVIIQWSIEDLITIKIPIEAVFPFGADAGKWHIYLGARKDLGQPVTVDVLGIVKGTGYLMFKGDGLPSIPVQKATLPEIHGFAIGVGVGASFTWGDTDAGLYLTVGGGMDAVVGFDPFILAGTIWVVGELRIFIVSIGADAQLTAKVAEQPNHDLDFSAHGEACGHIDFFFFSVSGCVDIDINSDPPASPMPVLVDKVTLKSRSPALLQGTGVDRGIDASLGDATATKNDPKIPVVPIDAIPVISMNVPPVVPNAMTVTGVPAAVIPPAPSLTGNPVGYAERSGDKYRFDLTAIRLERIDGAGNPLADTVSGAGAAGSAPVVWWSINPAAEASPAAQLALFTWDPSPAMKAVEKTQHLVDDLVHRWGTVCARSADPAEVLWTFRFEDLGPSPIGWDLDGIAWPDDPNTVRTAAPDTTLAVSERWRSGDLQLDNMRGIIAAQVVGAGVKCHDGGKGDNGGISIVGPRLAVGGRGPVLAARPSGQAVNVDDTAFGRLVRNGAQVPFRVSERLLTKVQSVTAHDAGLAELANTPPDVALNSVLSGIAAGAAVPRAAQIAAGVDLGVYTSQQRGICIAKVLQAPMLDNGDPIAIGDPQRREEVQTRLDKLGVLRHDLDDVVILHTGGIELAYLLLLVSREQQESWPLVRVADEKDGTIDRLQTDAGFLITPAGVPSRWDDPAGPWADDVDDVFAFAAARGLLTMLVPLKGYRDAATVEIGCRRDPGVGKQLVPPYWVGAFSMIGEAEVTRHDWDETTQTSDRQILTNLLGPAATDDVLLIPDSLYRLTVSSYGIRDADHATRGSSAQPESQEFWFRTDTIANGPADPHADPVAAGDVPALHFTSTPPTPVRLDPWMLMTIPADGETGFFTQQNTKLVFNTQDVERIFGAYGKELRVRVEAASGRHPAETGDGVTLPLAITPDLLTPVQKTVLTPYEDAMRDAAIIIGEQSEFCVDIDLTAPSHSELDLAIPFDRTTGYILDVELVDKGAVADARGPRLLRRQFTTGMFSSTDDLADSIVGTRVTGRGASSGAVAGIAARFTSHAPEGAEFDDAWRDAGFGPLGAAASPRITVLWETPNPALPPQPTGILVEATAPLTRSRAYPSKITDSTGPTPAERWALADRAWLDLDDSSAAGVVAAIVRSPGADRYLIVLGSNARGKAVAVDLVEAAFPDLPFLNQTEHRRTIVQTSLDHAPWEEE
jgi:hypothetical protein